MDVPLVSKNAPEEDVDAMRIVFRSNRLPSHIACVISSPAVSGMMISNVVDVFGQMAPDWIS